MRVRKAFTCSGTSEGLSYFICCASFLLVLYSTESFHFHKSFFLNVITAGSQEGVVGSLRL